MRLASLIAALWCGSSFPAALFIARLLRRADELSAADAPGPRRLAA